MDDAELIKKTKAYITSLLTSSPLRCTVRQLGIDYRSTIGEIIPYHKLGYNSLEHFLVNIPDTVKVVGIGPNAEVKLVYSEKSGHIANLVSKQRTARRLPRNRRFRPITCKRSPPTRPPVSQEIPKKPPPYYISQPAIHPIKSESTKSLQNDFKQTENQREKFCMSFEQFISKFQEVKTTSTKDNDLRPLSSNSNCYDEIEEEFVYDGHGGAFYNIKKVSHSTINEIDQSPSIRSYNSPKTVSGGTDCFNDGIKDVHEEIVWWKQNEPPKDNVYEEKACWQLKECSKEESEQRFSSREVKRDHKSHKKKEGSLKSRKEKLSRHDTILKIKDCNKYVEDHSSVVLEKNKKYVDDPSCVPEHIQERLQELIADCDEGMWCAELPNNYKKRFGRSLHYHRYGYRSLIEMCVNLPHIFIYIRPSTDDFKLYDATKPLPPSANAHTKHISYQKIAPKQDLIVATPNLTLEDCLRLFPEDIMKPGKEIKRLEIPEEWLSLEKSVELGEVYDPSKFWLNFTEFNLKRLSQDLDFFYRAESEKYMIPEFLLKEGLYCAQEIFGKYHRCLIVNLLPDSVNEVKVYCIDYGTTIKVSTKGLCFLSKQFAQLPAQAVRARLADICPLMENEPWTTKCTQRFYNLAYFTKITAKIMSIHQEEQILYVYIADTSRIEIIYVNDILVSEGLAKYAWVDKDKGNPYPTAVPLVKNIHLFPTFFELEFALAPSYDDMQNLDYHNVELNFCLPQYYKSHSEEDQEFHEKIERDHEKLLKTFNPKITHTYDINELIKYDESVDLEVFGDLAEEIKDFMEKTKYNCRDEQEEPETLIKEDTEESKAIEKCKKSCELADVLKDFLSVSLEDVRILPEESTTAAIESPFNGLSNYALPSRENVQAFPSPNDFTKKSLTSFSHFNHNVAAKPQNSGIEFTNRTSRSFENPTSTNPFLSKTDVQLPRPFRVENLSHSLYNPANCISLAEAARIDDPLGVKRIVTNPFLTEEDRDPARRNIEDDGAFDIERLLETYSQAPSVISRDHSDPSSTSTTLYDSVVRDPNMTLASRRSSFSSGNYEQNFGSLAKDKSSSQYLDDSFGVSSCNVDLDASRISEVSTVSKQQQPEQSSNYVTVQGRKILKPPPGYPVPVNFNAPPVGYPPSYPQNFYNYPPFYMQALYRPPVYNQFAYPTFVRPQAFQGQMLQRPQQAAALLQQRLRVMDSQCLPKGLGSAPPKQLFTNRGMS